MLWKEQETLEVVLFEVYLIVLDTQYMLNEDNQGKHLLITNQNEILFINELVIGHSQGLLIIQGIKLSKLFIRKLIGND